MSQLLGLQPGVRLVLSLEARWAAPGSRNVLVRLLVNDYPARDEHAAALISLDRYLALVAGQLNLQPAVRHP